MDGNSSELNQPGRVVERVVAGDPSVVVYGSDRRVPGGATGSCRLCQREHPLELGHVVPKWAYRQMGPTRLSGVGCRGVPSCSRRRRAGSGAGSG